MILNLGVINMPYAGKGSSTTSEVAQILEDKYDVIGTYVDLHLDEIAESLENSVSGALENVMMGAPTPANPFASAESAIEEQFKFEYLSQGEIEGKVAGTPTQAALDRRSSRFKKGKRKNARPSFIDTGLYQSSFKAWVE